MEFCEHSQYLKKNSNNNNSDYNKNNNNNKNRINIKFAILCMKQLSLFRYIITEPHDDCSIANNKTNDKTNNKHKDIKALFESL